MEEFKSQEEIIFPEIAKEIIAMEKVDQDMREKNLQDHESWDDNVDKNNTQRMKEIVAEIGWPTISKVGRDASDGAWCLVQHANHDTEIGGTFQKDCLNLMKELPEREVKRRNVALLEDRVMLKEVGFQVYGTQFEQKDGKHIPRPIIDPEHVDERRKAMGLGTLEEGIQQMYEKYGKPKPL